MRHRTPQLMHVLERRLLGGLLQLPLVRRASPRTRTTRSRRRRALTIPRSRSVPQYVFTIPVTRSTPRRGFQTVPAADVDTSALMKKRGFPVTKKAAAAPVAAPLPRRSDGSRGAHDPVSVRSRSPRLLARPGGARRTGLVTRPRAGPVRGGAQPHGEEEVRGGMPEAEGEPAARSRRRRYRLNLATCHEGEGKTTALDEYHEASPSRRGTGARTASRSRGASRSSNARCRASPRALRASRRRRHRREARHDADGPGGGASDALRSWSVHRDRDRAGLPDGEGSRRRPRRRAEGDRGARGDQERRPPLRPPPATYEQGSGEKLIILSKTDPEPGLLTGLGVASQQRRSQRHRRP